MTAVRPPARFGALTLEDDPVRQFNEKPQDDGGCINGGFFVLSTEGCSITSRATPLCGEEPHGAPCRRRATCAYQHTGFWQPMDTLRDTTLLEELWAAATRRGSLAVSDR